MTGTQSPGTAGHCRWCGRKGDECVPRFCDHCHRMNCPSVYAARMCVACRPNPKVEREMATMVAHRVREAIDEARTTDEWRAGS